MQNTRNWVVFLKDGTNFAFILAQRGFLFTARSVCVYCSNKIINTEIFITHFTHKQNYARKVCVQTFLFAEAAVNPPPFSSRYGTLKRPTLFARPSGVLVRFNCSFTVTYHGRRDADYTVVIGSRATGLFFFSFLFFTLYKKVVQQSATLTGLQRPWTESAFCAHN